MAESVILLSRILPLFIERENKVIDTTFKLVTHLDDSLFIEIIKANTLWRAIPYVRVTHLLLSEDTESAQPYYKARDNSPLFFFTLSTDSDALHYIIPNSRDDIDFLIELLQLFHTLPYPGLPRALFEAAIRNLSPGVSDIYDAQRLPEISMSPTQGYSQVIDAFKQNFHFQQIVYQHGSGQPTAQLVKYISYWPIIAIFMASCLVLLATGPYSNQSYTILHLLSMRTQSFNFLLSHINTIVFYTASDETLGYIEVIQSSSLYKDQAIVLHLNMSYMINYMFQFKELSRFPPSYRVPDLLSVPLFARNRVDVQESSLFSLYTKGVFCSLKGKLADILTELSDTIPGYLAALEPLSILIRSSVLRGFTLVPDKIPSLCLSNILQVMETILNTLTSRYMKLTGHTEYVSPPGVSLDDHEEGRISIVFTPGLYEGDISHLIISDEYSKALVLQHILSSLFLPSHQREIPIYYKKAPLLPSIIKYINPDGTLSDPYRLDMTKTSGDILDGIPLSPLIKGSILYFIIKAVAEIIMSPSPNVPDAVKVLLAKATVSVRINYGQPSETASGHDNVLTEFVLSPDNSGGGDASLFLDAPGTLCPLLHFLVASQNTSEEYGLLSVFEYWTRIGIKGYPPAVALAPDFFAQAAQKNYLQQTQNLLDDINQMVNFSPAIEETAAYRYVPPAPVILLDINVLPSSRQAFINLGQDMASIRTENERCIKEYYAKHADTRREESIEDLINISDMFYYFIQTNSIDDVLKRGTLCDISSLNVDSTQLIAPSSAYGTDIKQKFTPVLHKVSHDLIHFTEAAAYISEIDIHSNVGVLDTTGRYLGTDLDMQTPADSVREQTLLSMGIADQQDVTTQAGSLIGPVIPSLSLTETSFATILEVITVAGLLRSVIQHLTGFARYFISLTLNVFYLKLQSLSLHPLLDVEKVLRFAASYFASVAPDTLPQDCLDSLSHDVLALVQGRINFKDPNVPVSRRQSEIFNAPKGEDLKPNSFNKQIFLTFNLDTNLLKNQSTFFDVQYGIENRDSFYENPRLLIIPHYRIMLGISKYVFDHQNAPERLNDVEIDKILSKYINEEMLKYVKKSDHTYSATTNVKLFEKTLEGLLKTAYNCVIDNGIMHLFRYDFDSNARLPSRRYVSPGLIHSVRGIKVPWATLRSMYPEFVSIPNAGIHVPVNKEVEDMITLDLGFVPHHGRASLMAFYTSILPSYLSQLRNKYVNVLIQPSIDSIEHPFYPFGEPSTYKKNQLPKSYELGGIWLSSILHNIFNISRILITSAAYNEPVVSIAPLDRDERCLILRCIEVSFSHVDSDKLLGLPDTRSIREDTNTINGPLNCSPEISLAISEVLTPGLVCEIMSLMGDSESSGLPRSARYTNPFHSLFTFKILSVEALFGHICTKLKLHTLLPLITFLRTTQYALTNRNSAEVELEVPPVFALNAHDSLDLFAKVCISTLRAEFTNIPNLSVSTRRHLIRTINSCPFLVIGSELKTEALVCAGKENRNPVSGKVCFNIGMPKANRDVYKRVRALSQTSQDRFVMLNTFLADKSLSHYSITLFTKVPLDNGYCIGFGYIIDKSISDVFVIDTPVLMCIIIPDNFDCTAPELFDKSRCLINAPVIVTSSPSFIENTTFYVSISQEDIKKANESITAELSYPIANMDGTISQLRYLESRVLSSIAESIQALPARLQALRYSCSDIQRRLGGEIDVSLLPMSFSLGQFSTKKYIETASMLSFAETLASSLFAANVLPISINYALYLTNQEKIRFQKKPDNTNRKYIPINLMLLGPEECILPESISPLVFIIKLLKTESLEKLVQMIDKDDTGKILLALVPILLVDKFSLQFSNDSLEVSEKIKQQAEIEKQNRLAETTYSLFDMSIIEEHVRNTVNEVFGKNFGPTKSTNAAADERVYGPYLYLGCDPAIWKRLYDAIQRSTHKAAFNSLVATCNPTVTEKGISSNKMVMSMSLLIGARLRYDMSLGKDGLIDYINWKKSYCKPIENTAY
ncbi:Hypothetical protein GLP15_89 [Giardia lamblia P15]|uniref:Uncharacterized protein n=1 Tax=Giardia intestinalis (strain P15) TaxID=658858 RepID=E1F8G8_GIAIA|nr:Hypothetical protein GLP15_89 [Giardia lamblia P15]